MNKLVPLDGISCERNYFKTFIIYMMINPNVKNKLGIKKQKKQNE